MDEKKHAAETQDELIGVLIAISIVSKRLAAKLSRLKSNSEGGDKSDGPTVDKAEAPDADQSNTI